MAETEGELPQTLLHRHIAHYHGDTVRVLFVVSAIGLLIAETTGASLPLPMEQVVGLAILLVVAAGITNPAQTWIHFINALLAIYGAAQFGLFAIQQYHKTRSFTSQDYLFAEGLAMLFLVAVYFTTKTVRGILLRPHLR